MQKQIIYKFLLITLLDVIVLHMLHLAGAITYVGWWHLCLLIVIFAGMLDLGLYYRSSIPGLQLLILMFTGLEDLVYFIISSSLGWHNWDWLNLYYRWPWLDTNLFMRLTGNSPVTTATLLCSIFYGLLFVWGLKLLKTDFGWSNSPLENISLSRAIFI